MAPGVVLAGKAGPLKCVAPLDTLQPIYVKRLCGLCVRFSLVSFLKAIIQKNYAQASLLRNGIQPTLNAPVYQVDLVLNANLALLERLESGRREVMGEPSSKTNKGQTLCT